MTSALVLPNQYVKTIKLLLVSFAFFVLFAAAMPAPARAAALTESQISAILSLLSSFGADQSVINNVNVALGGTAPVPNGPSVDIKAAQSNGPVEVGFGASVELSWVTSNVNNCSIIGSPGVAPWVGGSVGTSGTQTTGQLSGSITYSITCASTAGSPVSDSVRIEVTNQPSVGTLTV